MKKTEQIKLIDKTFYRLARCCESTHDWDKYMRLHQEEETGHRRFKPDRVQCGLTRAQSVRLFAVKEVFERFVPAHSSELIFTPQAKDFFSIRGSVFAACAIVDLKGDEILKEFTHTEMSQWLASVDYCELNKDPRTLKEAA